MEPLQKGRYTARLAQTPADLDRVLALRAAAFRAGGDDRDAQDAACRHVLVEDAAGAICAVYRLRLLRSGAELPVSYAAQFYDLSALAADPRPFAEMGRFCLAPGLTDPDVLRLAWGAMTRIVDAAGAGRMIGCTSFSGADWQAHRAALALLAERHLGPPDLRPGRRAPEVVDYPALAGPMQDRKAALAGLPPLLRSYLGMGGWVSDHAVVDRDLDTLHVFTCVDVAGLPAARAASLRALARG